MPVEVMDSLANESVSVKSEDRDFKVDNNQPLFYN